MTKACAEITLYGLLRWLAETSYHDVGVSMVAHQITRILSVLISIAMKKNIAIYIAQTWDIAINIGTSSNVVPVKFASK